MYSITFKSSSKKALEYLRETAYEKIPEMEEMTVEALDAMIKEPKERTHVTVCDNCGSSSIGYDCLVNDDNEIVGGPYDSGLCLYCEDINASVRVMPIDQIRECENVMECDYTGDMEMMVAGIGIKERPANTKGWLCPKCANPLVRNHYWTIEEN